MNKATIISQSRLRDDMREAHAKGTLEIVKKLTVFGGFPFYAVCADGVQVDSFDHYDEAEAFIKIYV